VGEGLHFIAFIFSVGPLLVLCSEDRSSRAEGGHPHHSCQAGLHVRRWWVTSTI